MNTVSTFDLPDLDQRVAALRWYIDAARAGAIAPNDPIHLKTGLLAMDLQAAAARLAPKNACNLTYLDMARAINAKNPDVKCRDTTLRNLHVFQYLEDKGLGGEFVTDLQGRTKTKFSERAVTMIAEHYPALLDYGWNC
ncbi:hypothetical protein NR402_13810 [Acidithiobacillus ferrooxidans]|uniref:hypothetical protein n=1 Tax=Acidithiobacillus ferrooxidans TaxID=920 RepID=UPI00214B74D6|nr:hypothetical protein [Acidithiobacillus ferrooxidans]MCR2831347.1 hypothetical protein [Acidithiobacillus ferrooxidans]